MRKVLALLMLVILPLQFAWAGAAVYCQHEASQSAQHFGHHVHVDQPTDGDQAKSAGGAGADCSYHLPAARCGFDVLGLAEPALAEVRNASPPPSFTSFIPDGLERPDRQPAAFSASGGPVRS